jgi:hypothetical protein
MLKHKSSFVGRELGQGNKAAQSIFKQFMDEDAKEMYRLERAVRLRNTDPQYNYFSLSDFNISEEDVKASDAVKKAIDDFNPNVAKLKRHAQGLTRRGWLTMAGTGIATTYLVEPKVSSWVDDTLNRPYKTLGFRNFEGSGDLHPRIQHLLMTMENNMHLYGLNTLLIRQTKSKAKYIPDTSDKNNEGHTKKNLIENRILEVGFWSSMFSKTYETPTRPRFMRDPEFDKAVEVETEGQEYNIHACAILTKEQAEAVQRKLDQLGKKDPVLANTEIEALSPHDMQELGKMYRIEGAHSMLEFKDLEDRTATEINTFMTKYLKPITEAVKSKQAARSPG